MNDIDYCKGTHCPYIQTEYKKYPKRYKGQLELQFKNK